jgi:hypothetical protein
VVKAPWQNFAVAAVGPRSVITVSIGHSTAQHLSMKVCRSVVIGDTAVFVLDLDLIDHVLEFTDNDHVTVNPDKVISCEVLFFIGDGFVVLVDRYGAECNLARFADILWIEKLTFGNVGGCMLYVVNCMYEELYSL